MSRPKGSRNKSTIDYMRIAEMEDTKIGTKTDETFSITVKDDSPEEKVIYENEKEPYSWYKVDNIYDAIRALGGEVADDAVSFIGEALPGEKNGEALKALTDLVNKTNRANAKNNRYQSVMNQYKPMSEDDAAKAFDRMVALFAKINKVSEDVARTTLSAVKA